MGLLGRIQHGVGFMTLMLEHMEETRKYLNIIQWVNSSPSLFCLSVAEINRRYAFSTAFKKVSAFSTAFKKVSAFSTAFKKVSAFSTAFRKVSAFSTAFRKVSAFSTAFKKVSSPVLV